MFTDKPIGYTDIVIYMCNYSHSHCIYGSAGEITITYSKKQVAYVKLIHVKSIFCFFCATLAINKCLASLLGQQLCCVT